MAAPRPIVHRLHDRQRDDLGLYDWPVPLDLGDTLTMENGRRFKVVAIVELGP